MLYDVFEWAWARGRPTEGWLPLLLLLFIVSLLASAVIAVDWVPEANIVAWTAILGLLLGSMLAARSSGWFLAWSLILGYGLVVTATMLGQLRPPLSVLTTGWEPSAIYFRQNWGLFIDRFGGWLEAAFGGGQSRETIVFAFGLGLLAWLLAAYAGWSTFRHHRPLAGLTVMGFALAVNGFYGNAPLWPLAIFVGLAALLAATVHYADLEETWLNKGVDFSREIRLELLMFSGAMALVLLSIAFIIPTVNFRAISRAVLNRPVVHEAEDTLSRIFAGVQQPQKDLAGSGPGGSSRGRRGNLPRSFLLGNPPELYETVIMTATASNAGSTNPTHWRGLSYDFYNGRGWTLTTERQEPIDANEDIALPPVLEQTVIDQTVRWVLGDVFTRYTLGLPQRFDQDVVAYWRGLEDLSRVLGRGDSYSAVSQTTTASPNQLRQSVLEDVPPAVIARYTQLPDTIPERVHQLAREAAGLPAESTAQTSFQTESEEPSQYDQAKALERFLRQYPYSLEVDLPPAGSDPVDFFLFDLQSGYCDYYASSMVVMARSLGLPARLATGFLPQPAGENGVQTIYQINAHSWAEIYFADYGWVEFEPTAAFPSSETRPVAPEEPNLELQEPVPFIEPPPIPEPEPKFSFPYWLLGFLVLFPIVWWLWRGQQRKREKLDDICWAYSRLQLSARRLGQPATPSQTPTEFEEALRGRLQQMEGLRLAGQLDLKELYPEIERLTAAFINRQYAGKKPPGELSLSGWRRIRGRMWLLGLLNRFQ